MRLSKLYTKTSKTVPSGEEAKNAQLLIKAGFVHKEMAGAYDYLPLGFKVLENIKKIVREELEKIDANEILMTTLQRREVWERTTRWKDGVMKSQSLKCSRATFNHIKICQFQFFNSKIKCETNSVQKVELCVVVNF